MGTTHVLAVLVLVLLLVVNHGFLAVARGFSKFSELDSCRNVSCNVTLEDKRGVPTGANPLHNR
ncbi:hypothetical protein I3760_07G038100 [Carya illinoinensis]|nr:hypothetical protein I3760_07G038100 [Carya illinoinensis]